MTRPQLQRAPTTPNPFFSRDEHRHLLPRLARDKLAHLRLDSLSELVPPAMMSGVDMSLLLVT